MITILEKKEQHKNVPENWRVELGVLSTACSDCICALYIQSIPI
jgi:hypothetical protein